MGDKLIAVARRRGLITREREPISSQENSTQIFKYNNHGYSFLRTNEKISDDNLLLTDTMNLLVFNLNSKTIIWIIILHGFGDQREDKSLPFLYKAAWIDKD